MSAYVFVVSEGPDEGRELVLKPGVTMIGRRDTPDPDDPQGSHRWILTDLAVSRTHARLDWDGTSKPRLTHLSSTNATLLAGKIVNAHSVETAQETDDGQELRMGQTAMRVELRAQAPEPDQFWVLESLQGEASEIQLKEPHTVAGIMFESLDQGVKVTLSEATEGYLLRLIDEQLWTTSLEMGKAVRLHSEDIIRAENLKLRLVQRQN